MLTVDRDALLARQNAALTRFGVRLELRGAQPHAHHATCVHCC
jgi:hypothetical protein